MAQVAPFTGAWIEIFILSQFLKAAIKSHPSRVRGLKYSKEDYDGFKGKSHPSRVRGLKLLDCPTRPDP